DHLRPLFKRSSAFAFQFGVIATVPETVHAKNLSKLRTERETLMSKFRKDKKRVQAEPESRRRKNAYSERMREYLSPNTARPVNPPVVVGPLLSDPAYLSFANFLSLPETRELFGLGNDAAN